MAETIFLCIGAGMFSGVFERTGVLSRLMDQLRKIVKSVGGLVFSVTLTGIALMFGGAGQSCTLSLPAIAFRDAFEDMDVHPGVPLAKSGVYRHRPRLHRAMGCLCHPIQRTVRRIGGPISPLQPGGHTFSGYCSLNGLYWIWCS